MIKITLHNGLNLETKTPVRRASRQDRSLPLFAAPANLDHPVVDRQWFRRVRCHKFAVYEVNGAAGIVEVKFRIDRLVALHFHAHGDGVNHWAGILS